MRQGASAPVPPAPKRTIVGTGPKPPKLDVDPADTARLQQPRVEIEAQRVAAAPTLTAVPGQRSTHGQPGSQGHPTEDFQATRNEHRGTQLTGTEGLAEPGSEQPRIRLIPGKVVPGTRYRITRWLGEGGMGVVYEAEHIDIERKVALKILRFDLSHEAQMAQVFRDEARAASRVGSKNIVEIYDFGELADGRLYFCMEMIPGGDLVPASEDEWIEPGRLIGLLRQICKGLAAAHKAGIIHRDIKPENIILVHQEGREIVKIVDFGISAMIAAGTQGKGNTIAGTPHYMAPEQITGEEFDGRLDIYATGCMAYELLVGTPPFMADDIQELLKQQLYEQPKPLRACRPDREIPQELADVIMKCLAKKPEERWADMVDLEAALCEAQIAAGLTTPWDDLPLPEVDPERRERLVRDMPNPHAIVLQQGNRWLLPVIAGVGALLIGIGVTWVMLGGPPTEAEVSQIDELTNDARAAGSKTQWVFPPATEPSAPTAYQKVVALEGLEGSADEPGDERAAELRQEFFETLNVLGERYWDIPGARGFAHDYYAMAHLFNPDDETARARSGRTDGQLADFRERAGAGDFTESELLAAGWLDVLAEEDKEVAGKMAEELLAKGGGSMMMGSGGLDAMRGAGIVVAAPKPAPAVEPTDDDGADETGGETGGETGDETGGEGEVADAGSKSGHKSGHKRKTDDEALGGATRDPSKAAALAEQGMTALRAGKRDEAKGLFNQAISYDRSNAMALMGLSDVYFDTGSNQKAVLYAEKAVTAAPKNSNYRIKLGDAYFKVLRYRDALEQYEKAKGLGASKADDRIKKAKDKIGG